MSKLHSLMNFMRGKRPNTAAVAKERLQIIISHEHSINTGRHINLPQLKQELLQVIAKYTEIDENKISIQVENDNNMSVLELSITLPDTDTPLKKYNEYNKKNAT